MARSKLPLAIALLGLIAPSLADASISGVCPDGSVFIVQRPEAIPCRQAKRVEPEDVPPINPEFLPRPYGWELFNQRNDPNNPYNAVEAARRQLGVTQPSPEVAGIPTAGLPPRPTGRSGLPTTGLPQPSATTGPSPIRAASGTAPSRALASTPAPAPTPSRGPAGPVLALSEQELRELSLIVEFSQRHAPATVVVPGERGPRRLVVRIARSESFDARLRQTLSQRGGALSGPALLFSAVAEETAEFWGNLTFVQGHMAFHPDPANPGEFGVLAGRQGGLAPGEAVLGYVVLPAHVDLTSPMDIYWNDRQMTAVLRP